MITRLIKFGGSLLGERRAFQWFEDWQARQTVSHSIVVVGGGRLVDCIRQWQADFQLADVDCHWLSIDAMSITAKLAHRMLPASSLVGQFQALRGRVGGLTVFDPGDWLRQRPDLPRSWGLTSDSIAAVLAAELDAEELVLLKSVLPQSRTVVLEELVDCGLVDDCFPTFGRQLKKIRIVNLLLPGEEIELVVN